MHIQVYHGVNHALGYTFTAREENENYLIGPEVRSFVSNFVFESLLFRSDEWRQEKGVDPDEGGYAGEIADLVGRSVAEILTTQATGNPGIGKQRLLLIDVVQKIQADWCKVFPFCR